MANNSTALTLDNLPAICHAGRPVVTTALLAKLYGADPKRIQNNFMRNADRFESGRHFFKLEGNELAVLRPSLGGSQISAKARSLILWTERGAARHAKMLDTEQAWGVFEKLEDCYFGKAVVAQALSVPAPVSYTLIGTTIGTDGFHMLGSVVKGKVVNLPVTIQRRATMKMWSQLHAAFGVRSAADIPSDQLDSARNFIAAYSLEGEWISKPQRAEGGIHLSGYETQHLYLLMSRFFVAGAERGRLHAAAIALESDPLMKVFSQLYEGSFSFSVLDKRRSEIYGEYKSAGLIGGYAALEVDRI